MESNRCPQNLTHQSFTRFCFVRYVFGLSFEKSNLKQGANWNVGGSTSYLEDNSYDSQRFCFKLTGGLPLTPQHEELSDAKQGKQSYNRCQLFACITKDASYVRELISLSLTSKPNTPKMYRYTTLLGTTPPAYVLDSELLAQNG